MSRMIVHDGCLLLEVGDRDLGERWNHRNPRPEDGGPDALRLARRGDIDGAVAACEAHVLARMTALLRERGKPFPLGGAPEMEANPGAVGLTSGWGQGDWRWIAITEVAERYRAHWKQWAQNVYEEEGR